MHLQMESVGTASAMKEAISLIVGGVIAWAITHVYYRQGKRDLLARFEALQQRFDGLQQVVQQAIDQGVVQAERTPAGEIRALGPPSAPTGFSLS
jgi:hypothetical protein